MAEDINWQQLAIDTKAEVRAVQSSLSYHLTECKDRYERLFEAVLSTQNKMDRMTWLALTTAISCFIGTFGFIGWLIAQHIR